MAVLFALLVAFAPLRWETNDDPGMAMAAHGYGLAAIGTPNLVYSNVLWGHLVRAIPSLGGVLGYSLAALAALFAAGWTLLHATRRAGAPWYAAIAGVYVVVIPAVLAPQFTLTAGLLTAAAVMAARDYARRRDPAWLVGAVALGLAGFLVRYEEFLLVLAV